MRFDTALVVALTTLPLTCDVASTEGDRAYGEPASGGKDVCRRGCVGGCEMTELFLRLPGGMFMSIVDGRFLLGAGAGDEYGGDMADGDVAYGGDAMIAVGEEEEAEAGYGK